ncbi:UBA domain-containing protein 7 [Mycena indigotica]|uniref:UBA domain-containing protein 7 n=1 Tax=Mycena indigotica TaxID=2126181 RepID=A0A8H6SGP2_9AGAR|nr:UBA domain-containing protein 7 [Mycena indigotica]KAF7299270.1 UBA domain-containing protein 7 [Mycena indigotica]
MSDSFADLWNSSAPTKPAPPPQKLGASPQVNSYNNNASRRPQNDLFSMLSAASSPSSSRPITPNTRAQQQQTAKPVSHAGNGDAFSSLLGGSLNGGNSQANMTMAQRAQMQQVNAKTSSPVPSTSSNSAWAGLDSLGSFASPPPAAAKSGSSSMLDDDDWGFMNTPVTAPSPAVAPSKTSSNDLLSGGGWNSSSPVPKKSPSPKPTHKSMGMWDHIDDFSSPPTKAASTPPTRYASPSTDFDFGDREDRTDDFDLLGDLGKPVSEISSQRQSTPPAPRTAQQPRQQQPKQQQQQQRSPSPPPHVLGQLIEMGFTIPQSRAALSQVYNDGQWDVQSAIDSLLASTGGAEGSSRRASPAPPSHPSKRRQDDRERAGSPRQPPERNTTPTTTNDLLARTTELGFSLFRNAERAWQQGKERVQKAYEERVTAGEGEAASSSAYKPQNGRPKWMQQQEVSDDEDKDMKGKSRRREDSDSLFKDEDDEDRKDDGWGDQPKPRKETVTAPPPTADLFGTEEVSKPVQQQRSRPQKPAPKRTASSRPSAPPVPTIPPRVQVPLSSSTLRTSRTHSAGANEKINLGQYAAASALYTLAIDALPGGHVLLVPLLTKRAEARLKEGDFRGVEEDCVNVEGIASEGGRTLGVEGVIKVEADGEMVDIDIGGAVLEAWKRRAEALEGRERWADAGKDWERVAGASWAGTKDRDEGVRGAGRCRKMLEPKPVVAAPKPKPKPAPSITKPTGPPPEAVAKYRAAIQAQEDEDTAKYQLKDTVDGKLLAWKGGKETNIRALLASLDTILWPELGLQTSGMKDLVTPGQVKIRYVKAIAKLHPDKLNASNSTLEQRMLANGVFGALNEAWNAFK